MRLEFLKFEFGGQSSIPIWFWLVDNWDLEGREEGMKYTYFIVLIFKFYLFIYWFLGLKSHFSVSVSNLNYAGQKKCY